MNNSIENIIYASIIGDAAGYTLNGMKSVHIKAVFRDEEGYPDPAPALKGKIDRWRKPGLYSSITQLMLLATASIERNVFRADRFIDAVKKAPEHPDSEFSFFREPGLAEQYFIMSSRTDNKESVIPFTKSCARVLPVSVPLLAVNERGLLSDVLRFVSLFTTDTSTAVYTYFYLQMLKDLSSAESQGTFSASVTESAKNSLQNIMENQHKIFECGYNPDYVLESAKMFIEILQRVFAVKDIREAEKIICDSANLKLKTPVTRGSVNIPETVLPFAIALSDSTAPHGAVFHSASREGGAASALASISAALTTAFFGLDIPEGLKGGLANKKKISSIIELIASKGNWSEITRILYESEPALTSKEMEEYRARNKKEPKKPARQKSRKEVESELAKHVVESWTKIDKAKWRKERNKHES